MSDVEKLCRYRELLGRLMANTNHIADDYVELSQLGILPDDCAADFRMHAETFRETVAALLTLLDKADRKLADLTDQN